ncbi:MAG: hypothetical protein GY906_05195 [bacterium]|nr:hypothetical protein [bacterium]
MSQRINLEVVIGHLYEAVSDPSAWNGALEAAGQLLAADAMLLTYGNPSANDLRIIGSTGWKSHAQEIYADEFLLHDEMIREAINGPIGAIVSANQSFFDSTVNQHILHQGGFTHFTGAALMNTPDIHASLWMARAIGASYFSRSDIKVFTDLLPHATRAVTAFHRIREAELRSEMAMGAFDRVANGVVLLDVKGTPVMVNREAKRIADAEDGFTLRSDGIVAHRPTDTTRLRDLVRCAGSERLARQLRGAVTARLERPSGLADYHVVVLPLPKKCQPSDHDLVVAVLFITDLSQPKNPSDHLFGDLYGLTDAETRLVTQLLKGGGLTTAAERLGISRNTVHSQLASVFQKTETKSQSELLTLLLTAVAPIRPPDESSGFYGSVFDA